MAKTNRNEVKDQPTADKTIDKQQKNKKEPRDTRELMGFVRAVPIILVASALFITLCFITGQTGAFGNFISGLFKGLFSYMAYTIPAFILIHAITFSSDFKNRYVLKRLAFTVVSLVMLSMIAFIIPNIGAAEEVAFDPSGFYMGGIANAGGGFIGGVLAFALTKLFGYVGLLIIIAVVFIIFAVVSFYGSGKEITIFILKKLAAIFNLGARMEEKATNKKQNKAKEKEERKRAAEKKKNAAFYNDDFFYTDNGVSELEIPELGIVETKKNAGYVLRETVIHNEPVAAEEPTTERSSAEDPIKHKVSSGYAETIVPSTEEDNTKYRDDDIVIEIRPDSVEKTGEPESEPKSEPKVTLADLGISDKADDIFTESFDPFDIALNQKQASRPSSRASEITQNSPRGYSEFVSNLTPEEAERLERLRKFEECKAAAAKRKEEAEEAARIKAREEEEAAARLEEERIEALRRAEEERLANERRAEEERLANERRTEEERADIDEASDNSPADPEEAITKVTVNQINDDYISEYGNVNKRADSYRFVAGVVSNTERSAESKSTASAYGSVARTLAAEQEESVGSPSYNTKSEAPKTAFVFTPIADEEKSTVANAPTHSEPSEAPVYSAATVDDAPTSSVFAASKTETTLYFSDEDDDTVEEDDRIEITREQIGDFGSDEEQKFGLDFSEDDEDELPDSFTDEDGEEIVPLEQIPEEEQNPVISEYRGMFDIFKNDESSDEDETADEDTDKTAEFEDGASENNIDEPGEYVAPIDDIEADGEDEAREDEYSEDSEDYDDSEAEQNEDEDEPPFDDAEEIIKPLPKEQKKQLVPDYSNYKFPPIDLLKKGQSEDYSKITDELQESSEKLIGALEAFNIAATVRSMERGPRITRYSIVPARGVRVSQIEKLADDIALAMAAESIRIEAPIPGKSAVGVEVPNKIPSIVTLRDLLESDEFMNEKSKTAVCIGKSVEGSLVFGDIAKMPHLLVAGATGMGKSVCMNSLITSMLYKARPDEVKFIMIDPKKVEFAPYNGIPHLLVPVVTDPKQAAGTLMWAVDEMNKRYDIIEKLCVRGIDSYNEKVAENPELGAPMPKIVIFIDELNDLMIQVRDPVENLIMLIAQKARAAGIHLVIGTQRPSVNVITGVIKANIPSRIACKVSSSIDSRTILEQTGAEKLIGKGDMLFSPGGNAPKRVQGAYVSESETATIVDFVKNQVKGGVMYDEQAMEDMKRAAQKCDKNKNDGGDFDDEEESDVGYLHDRKFLDAVELAIRNGSVATSFLQRKLRIGYGKAAQYIDIMEDLGIVGEKNGSKPRDILISMSEWQEKLSRLTLDDY